jgi:hypothetical protein
LRVLHKGRTGTNAKAAVDTGETILLRRLNAPLLQLALAGLLSIPATALANHAVLIEGDQDYDGDGRLGVMEDTDGVDGVFGTINAALAAANIGLNQNGKAIIVTSGRFPETVNITGPVTLEGAPGVEADIEAFLAATDPRLAQVGDTNPMMGNAGRANAPGIIVNVPVATARPVVIRNITSRNWTDGIRVVAGQVKIENVRIEHNTNHGINVLGDSRVQISNSSIDATGFRINPTLGMFPLMNAPAPGIGVRFQGTSTGSIQNTSITNNFSFGLALNTVALRDVLLRNLQIAGNNFNDPASERTLKEACRQATNSNLDETDVCVQFFVRQVPPTPPPMMP